MAENRLRSITVEGFTSIRSASVRLGDLNVLVGANGAGKSNFIAAVEMLGRIVDGDLGLWVGRAGGASTLIHGGGKGASRIMLGLDFEPNGYRAELVAGAGDELIFGEEQVWFQGEGYEEPYVEVLGRGHRETRLRETVEQDERYSISRYVVDKLRGCRVYHFHDTSRNSPVKGSGYVADNLALHPDARNLAAVLLRLRETDRSCYDRILYSVRQVAPFFRDFVLEPENDRLLLRWRQEGSDVVFPADALSDGTLRFICMATLLNQPDRPALVVLDEPELGLHPYAIVQLAEMLRVAGRQSQVLIATQSVTLMNQFGIDELIVVEREAGASVFNRPEPEGLSEWLEEYSLGELWEKNLIGGRPLREER